MPGFLLTAAGCGFSAVFQDNSNWIGINALVVVLAMTIGGFMYSMSNLLPPAMGEKLKRITKYEMFEGFISIFIIAGLFALSTFACNATSILAGPSVAAQAGGDVFVFDTSYIGNLLFVNGVNVMSNLYSTSINLVVASNLFTFIAQQASAALAALFSVVKIGEFITVQVAPGLGFVLQAYSNTLTGFYSVLMLTAFGPLFIIFLLLPIIKAVMLTVVVPVSIVMRSLSYVGPKVREASNLFLSLAIGFYFILPLMIAFDAYLASCLNIGGIGLGAGSCVGYPLAQYASSGGYSLPTVPSSIFTGGGGSLPLCTGAPTVSCIGGAIPTCFASNTISCVGSPPTPICSDGTTPTCPSGAPTCGPPPTVCSYAPSSTDLIGTFVSTAFSLPGLEQALNEITAAPNQAVQYGETVASYLFLGLVMIGIDMAVTVGFINGFGKGLNAISTLFGVEPFWGE